MSDANPSEETVATGDVTREGERVIQRWLDAQEDVKAAKSALTRAECEDANAHSALAKWLMPSDMKPGEKIGVWVGDSLFQVELVERKAYPAGVGGEPHITHEPKVTVRTRGKNFWRLSA